MQKEIRITKYASIVVEHKITSEHLKRNQPICPPNHQSVLLLW